MAEDLLNNTMPDGSPNPYSSQTKSNRSNTGFLHPSYFSQYKQSQSDKKKEKSQTDLTKSIQSLHVALERDRRERMSMGRNNGSIVGESVSASKSKVARMDNDTKRLSTNLHQSMNQVQTSTKELQSSAEMMSKSISAQDKLTSKILSRLEKTITSFEAAAVQTAKAVATPPMWVAKQGIRGAEAGGRVITESQQAKMFEDALQETKEATKHQMINLMFGMNPVLAMLGTGAINQGAKLSRAALNKLRRSNGYDINMNMKHQGGVVIAHGGAIIETRNGQRRPLTSDEQVTVLKEGETVLPTHEKDFLKRFAETIADAVSNAELMNIKFATTQRASGSLKKVKPVLYAAQEDYFKDMEDALRRVQEESELGLYGSKGDPSAARLVFSNTIPLFGSQFRADLPNVRRLGLNAAMYRMATLQYVASRHASKEMNNLILQQSQILASGLGVKGKIKSPGARRFTEAIAGGIRRVTGTSSKGRYGEFERERAGLTLGLSTGDGPGIYEKAGGFVKKTWGDGFFGGGLLRRRKETGDYDPVIYKSVKKAIKDSGGIGGGSGGMTGFSNSIGKKGSFRKKFFSGGYIGNILNKREYDKTTQGQAGKILGQMTEPFEPITKTSMFSRTLEKKEKKLSLIGRFRIIRRQATFEDLIKRYKSEIQKNAISDVQTKTRNGLSSVYNLLDSLSLSHATNKKSKDYLTNKFLDVYEDEYKKNYDVKTTEQREHYKEVSETKLGHKIHPNAKTYYDSVINLAESDAENGLGLKSLRTVTEMADYYATTFNDRRTGDEFIRIYHQVFRNNYIDRNEREAREKIAKSRERKTASWVKSGHEKLTGGIGGLSYDEKGTSISSKDQASKLNQLIKLNVLMVKGISGIRSDSSYATKIKKKEEKEKFWDKIFGTGEKKGKRDIGSILGKYSFGAVAGMILPLLTTAIFGKSENILSAGKGTVIGAIAGSLLGIPAGIPGMLLGTAAGSMIGGMLGGFAPEKLDKYVDFYRTNKTGITYGAIIGGTLGLMFGPAGMAAGVAIGSFIGGKFEEKYQDAIRYGQAGQITPYLNNMSITSLWNNKTATGIGAGIGGLIGMLLMGPTGAIFGATAGAFLSGAYRQIKDGGNEDKFGTKIKELYGRYAGGKGKEWAFGAGIGGLLGMVLSGGNLPIAAGFAGLGGMLLGGMSKKEVDAEGKTIKKSLIDIMLEYKGDALTGAGIGAIAGMLLGGFNPSIGAIGAVGGAMLFPKLKERGWFDAKEKAENFLEKFGIGKGDNKDVNVNPLIGGSAIGAILGGFYTHSLTGAAIGASVGGALMGSLEDDSTLIAKLPGWVGALVSSGAKGAISDPGYTAATAITGSILGAVVGGMAGFSSLGPLGAGWGVMAGAKLGGVVGGIVGAESSFVFDKLDEYLQKELHVNPQLAAIVKKGGKRAVLGAIIGFLIGAPWAMGIPGAIVGATAFGLLGAGEQAILNKRSQPRIELSEKSKQEAMGYGNLNQKLIEESKTFYETDALKNAKENIEKLTGRQTGKLRLKKTTGGVYNEVTPEQWQKAVEAERNRLTIEWNKKRRDELVEEAYENLAKEEGMEYTSSDSDIPNEESIKGMIKELIPLIPKKATGGITRHHMSLVGERGPEVVALPAGSRVMPNMEMRNLVKGEVGGLSAEELAALDNDPAWKAPTDEDLAAFSGAGNIKGFSQSATDKSALASVGNNFEKKKVIDFEKMMSSNRSRVPGLSNFEGALSGTFGKEKYDPSSAAKMGKAGLAGLMENAKETASNIRDKIAGGIDTLRDSSLIPEGFMSGRPMFGENGYVPEKVGQVGGFLDKVLMSALGGIWKFLKFILNVDSNDPQAASIDELFSANNGSIMDFMFGGGEGQPSPMNMASSKLLGLITGKELSPAYNDLFTKTKGLMPGSNEWWDMGFDWIAYNLEKDTDYTGVGIQDIETLLADEKSIKLDEIMNYVGTENFAKLDPYKQLALIQMSYSDKNFKLDQLPEHFWQGLMVDPENASKAFLETEFAENNPDIAMDLAQLFATGEKQASSGGTILDILRNKLETMYQSGSNMVSGLYSAKGFVWPPISGYKTSDFGWRVLNGSNDYHEGIDLGNYGKSGAPVYSVMGGDVIFAGGAGRAGNMIKIRHDDGSIARYLHLNNINVRGGRVNAGDVIGGVGNTGGNYGVHLDFRMTDPQGNWVNPEEVFGMVPWKSRGVTQAGSLSQSMGRMRGLATSAWKNIKSVASQKLNPKIQESVEKYSRQYNIHPGLVYGMIQAESGFNPNDFTANKSGGARGLMQLIPSTAASLGVTDPFDIDQNIMGGTKYFRQLLDLPYIQGDPRLAIAAYNAGPGNVKKYGGIPPFQETTNHVRKVLKFAENYGYSEVGGPDSSSPTSRALASVNRKPLKSIGKSLFGGISNTATKTRRAVENFSNAITNDFLALLGANEEITRGKTGAASLATHFQELGTNLAGTGEMLGHVLANATNIIVSSINTSNDNSRNTNSGGQTQDPDLGVAGENELIELLLHGYTTSDLV